MRPCDTEQLALKSFAADSLALVVGEDRVPHRVDLGGAGHFRSFPALTLFVSAGERYFVGARLTVNILPASRPLHASVHLEDSDTSPAPRIADARVAFECVVLATGVLDSEASPSVVVVVRVLASYQRWPRGCAIA
jgi:hypothetical protein